MNMLHSWSNNASNSTRTKSHIASHGWPDKKQVFVTYQKEIVRIRFYNTKKQKDPTHTFASLCYEIIHYSYTVPHMFLNFTCKLNMWVVFVTKFAHAAPAFGAAVTDNRSRRYPSADWQTLRPAPSGPPRFHSRILRSTAIQVSEQPQARRRQHNINHIHNHIAAKL